MELILFLLFAAIALASAASLVLQTHPISSALSLIGVMVSLAAIYFLLGAEFVGAAQLVVYAGAIMVLFVFVIMLLNAGSEGPTLRDWRAGATALTLLVAFATPVLYVIHCQLAGPQIVKFGGFTGGAAGDVGKSVFSTYLLPFEATSVLILIAIVGAMVLARKEMD